MRTMKCPMSLICWGFAFALLMLGGCSTLEMKGSPFYTGEYAVNVPGAETRRVNLWPLAYYREPALSVVWPIFEHTEEHLALRPLFSAYGDTQTYWEYNVLWPLCQADTQGRDYRIFPLFWGEDTRATNIKQDYHILWPLVWHYEDETCALFPLWISDRNNWRDGRFTEQDRWLVWPLMHLHTGMREKAWHVALFGRYRYLDKEETFTGFPWPLFFSWRTRQNHGLFTPFYAYNKGTAQDVQDGWAALPLLLSWHRWQKDDNNLYALLGLFNRHWSDSNSSGYLFPLCAYDRTDRLFLTPLVGWDTPDALDPVGYWYPLTPLAGVRTGSERGGWLFPLFSHSLNTSIRTNNSAVVYERSREASRQLLLSYSNTSETTCRALTGDAQKGTVPAEANPTNVVPAIKPRTDYREATARRGLFPLWSTRSSQETRLNGSRVRTESDSSLLLALYDTRRESIQKSDTAQPLDYERRRILWRLWHYEKRNGDVSVDIFPTITYDTHTDGFSKISFLWRLFRYENHSGNGTDIDLLFLPLKRAH